MPGTRAGGGPAGGGDALGDDLFADLSDEFFTSGGRVDAPSIGADLSHEVSGVSLPGTPAGGPTDRALVGPGTAPRPLGDEDIRAALVAYLRAEHAQDAATLIVEELGLCEGSARVDIAVVNGVLAGFEIKSDRDTLERLPGQRRAYSRVLDQVTVVAGAAHLREVRRRVPRWWGILRATPACGLPDAPDGASGGTAADIARQGSAAESRGTAGTREADAPSAARGTSPQPVRLEVVRAPAPNPAVDAHTLVQLLWREEALAALRARNLAAGYARAPRRVLWDRLARALPLAELQRLVRDTLRARGGAWRSGGQSA